MFTQIVYVFGFRMVNPTVCIFLSLLNNTSSYRISAFFVQLANAFLFFLNIVFTSGVTQGASLSSKVTTLLGIKHAIIERKDSENVDTISSGDLFKNALCQSIFVRDSFIC